MTLARRRNRLTTDFPEGIPAIKRCVTVHSSSQEPKHEVHVIVPNITQQKTYSYIRVKSLKVSNRSG